MAWVAVGTGVLTVALYVVIPKGFFPLQDTGILQGTTEGAPSISFSAMIQRQQALADVLLHDPDVDSLSSFVGIDGTNTTLNNGRYLINLKPKAQRSADIQALLVLQDLDTAIDQHRHQRATLPERAELVALDGAVARLCDFSGGAVVQPDWRRPARCARPEVAIVSSLQ